MSKLLLVLSSFCLVFLLALGLADPDNPMVWLASTSVNFAYLRGALLLILIGLLLTQPPRNIYFRLFVGIVASGLASWSLVTTYGNDMKFLDTLSLLAVCTSSGLTVLETNAKLELARLAKNKNTTVTQ